MDKQTHALELKRSFAAPRERVFRAWTDATEIAKWFGPEGFSNTVHVMDVRAGGAYRMTMQGPDGAHTVSGVFREIVSPERIVMTWQWEGAPWESVVTVELKEADGGTELTLTHSGFPDEGAKNDHRKGWESSFIELEKVL